MQPSPTEGPTPEAIDHPLFYGGDTIYEVIKVIDAWQLDFTLGNIVKYVARAGKKGSSTAKEDLQKAEWYLHRRLMQLRTLK
jgi:hypothetical protein